MGDRQIDVSEVVRPGVRRFRTAKVDGGQNAGGVPSAAAAAGVSVTEYGNGVVHKTVFTLAGVSITMTDATTAGCHGALQLYDFPPANILYLGGVTDLDIVAGAGGIGDTAAVVGSVGTATVGTGDATLSGTEADLIPSTASTLTGGIGATDGQSTATSVFDGTATAKDAFLNFAVPDAGSTANDTLTVTGTVTLVWVDLGDN